jgi:hypothetical protein
VIKTNIKVIGKTPKEMQYAVHQKAEELKSNLLALGVQARDLMRSSIAAGVHRKGHGKLENSIDVEVTTDTMGNFVVGVGNIANLPPYWYVLNYGVRWDTGEPYIPPATHGYFNGNQPPYAELVGRGSDEFTHNAGGYLMEPRTPIRPINYIEIAENLVKLRMMKLGGGNFGGKIKVSSTGSLKAAGMKKSYAPGSLGAYWAKTNADRKRAPDIYKPTRKNGMRI